jgi:hypothetical protein
MKQVVNIRQELLEDLEGVISLDKIGADGRSHRFLVYLDLPQPEFYATDRLSEDSLDLNDFIVHIVSRQYNITIAEATIKCIKENNIVIIEDLQKEAIVAVYYTTVH